MIEVSNIASNVTCNSVAITKMDKEYTGLLHE